MAHETFGKQGQALRAIELVDSTLFIDGVVHLGSHDAPALLEALAG